MSFGASAIVARYKFLAVLLMFVNSCWAQSTHIFISFSMPKTSIQQWLSQAEKAHAQVHLRGFINNSFKQTMAEAGTLFKKDNYEGFLLDPKIFEQFKIEKVPAVVFVEDNQDYVVLYGDIGLKAAAEAAITRTNSGAAKKTLNDIMNPI